MRNVILLAFCFSFLLNASAQDTTQKIIPNRFNSAVQQKKSYVILISADGFRYDLAKKYNADNLLKLSGKGVSADYLQPSFPSLTFPNHYSIITGLYPAHHGIVDNTFFDGQKGSTYYISNKKAVLDSSWYGGTPLWVLAEQQGMVTASFYWVGSEASIQGVRPTYYYSFNEAIGIDKRLSVVKDWLQLPENVRPHFITFYLSEVDHAEHMYGPDSKETEEAVHFVDESIGKMSKMVESLGLDVNFIFVADHGMITVDNKNTLPLPGAVDTAKFLVLPGSTLLHLYAKDNKEIMPTYENIKKEAVDYDVYLAENMPARWHYSKSDDVYNRIGDIILVPHVPKIFNITKRPAVLGQHGYDPALTEMHATFYAWGPLFEKKKIAGFENVHIYPLVANILGLTYTQKIDGDISVLQSILKKSK